MDEPEGTNQKERSWRLPFPTFMVFAFLLVALVMVFRDCMA
jgi:hypothetical protein